MNDFLQQFKTLALSVSLVCFVYTPVLADDIEVFTGAFTSPDSANVLLIVDTSGSMDSTVEFVGIYDSSMTYIGSYAPGRYYWVDNGDDESDVDTDQWFDEAAFICNDAAEDITTQGYYKHRLAYWDIDDEKWYELNGTDNFTMVECRNDRGLHGDGTSITDVYAVNGSNGPFYDSNPNSIKIRWNQIDRVTVYSSNYLNYYESVTVGPRKKIEIVQDAAQAVLENVTGINIGLMRFSSDASGGMILHEIEDIATSAAAISTAVGNLDANGGTPLAETLYEAQQYFAGRAIDYGLDSVTISGGSYVLTPSVASSHDGTNYISPITNACQQNFAILLTDGDPTSDTNADGKIDSLPGFAGDVSCSGSGSISDSCLDDVAEYMATVDMSDDFELDQFVRTFTIGFDYSHPLLQQTADKGQGEFYRADNYDELYTALTSIFTQINEIDYSFVSPAVSVNTFNRLTHNNQLYFSVYRPSASPSWSGNIKRYALGYDDNGLTIVDATGSSAINPDTNAFRSDSKSFWTIGDPDGFDTNAGGFSSRLHATRNVYTDLAPASPLSHANNKFHKDNTAITNTHLGVTAAKRDSTLEWANGVDNTGAVINNIADALHNKPIIISYGGTLENPDLTLFYTTNAGYLHALDVNVNTGQDLERFAYIPLDLADRLDDHITNTVGAPKLYGLDGGISGKILNDNGNNYVDSGETAMIYMSMRRGGQNIYALDVTNRDAPEKAFQITPATTGFDELGETWSMPTYAKVKFNGASKDVILFGGGYDTNQDDAVPASDDSMGRAIYMIDAETGSLLWWAGNGDDYAAVADLPLNDMDYSIPSDLAVIDSNGDGFSDRIYVGDMGGQLWRFDFDSANTGATDFATGGVIARLGDTVAASTDNRRFYYPPSISQFTDNELGSFFALSIGSGHRANPLGDSANPINDRFYMIRDPYMFTTPESYTAIIESDLLDITNNLNPSTSDLNTHKGWMIDMRDDEKVISKATSIDNRIFFNSYVAGVSGDLTCDPSGGVGSGYAYSVSIGRGLPAQTDIPVDEDGDGIIDIEETGNEDCQFRCEDTHLPLPPEPLMVFVEPDPDYSECAGFSEIVTVIGTELKDPDICTKPIHTYWAEEE